MKNKITFEKVTKNHKETIFLWLSKPHVKEFWDNTQSHKDDILNFMDGRKKPSSYCSGKYIYWIAYTNKEPYAMLMTIQETYKDDIGELKMSHLSKTGNTYSLDYMIGNKKYLNKGYGAKTLIEFIDFFKDNFDKKADTFFIDPTTNNPRAKHVYEKAGFKHVDNFIMDGHCSGAGKQHHLLVKKKYFKTELKQLIKQIEKMITSPESSNISINNNFLKYFQVEELKEIKNALEIKKNTNESNLTYLDELYEKTKVDKS